MLIYLVIVENTYKNQTARLIGVMVMVYQGLDRKCDNYEGNDRLK